MATICAVEVLHKLVDFPKIENHRISISTLFLRIGRKMQSETARRGSSGIASRIASIDVNHRHVSRLLDTFVPAQHRSSGAVRPPVIRSTHLSNPTYVVAAFLHTHWSRDRSTNRNVVAHANCDELYQVYIWDNRSSRLRIITDSEKDDTNVFAVDQLEQDLKTSEQVRSAQTEQGYRLVCHEATPCAIFGYDVGGTTLHSPIFVP